MIKFGVVSEVFFEGFFELDLFLVLSQLLEGLEFLDGLSCVVGGGNGEGVRFLFGIFISMGNEELFGLFLVVVFGMSDEYIEEDEED